MARVSINFPDHIHFSMSQSVRIQDVNYRKHLGHDKLVSMIHDARAAFFESLGASELEDTSQGYILADLQIRYLDEAFFGDELNFDIAITEISNRSCQIHYQVSKSSNELNNSKIIARAKTGLVFYDYELRKSISVPQSIANVKRPYNMERSAAK